MQIVISFSLAVERNRDIPRSDKQVHRYLHQKFQENLASFFCVCLLFESFIACSTDWLVTVLLSQILSALPPKETLYTVVDRLALLEVGEMMGHK